MQYWQMWFPYSNVKWEPRSTILLWAGFDVLNYPIQTNQNHHPGYKKGGRNPETVVFFLLYSWGAICQNIQLEYTALGIRIS